MSRLYNILLFLIQKIIYPNNLQKYNVLNVRFFRINTKLYKCVKNSRALHFNTEFEFRVE